MSRQNVWGDEKVKRRKKVGESVNVKKKKLVQFDEHDFFFFFLNLSKILHFLFFKTKKERKYK